LRVQLAEGATAPTRAHESVGYDFYNLEDVTLPGFNVNEGPAISIANFKKEDAVPVVVRTGCNIILPNGHVGLLRDRSSYGVRGIIVTAGVIDPDYRGEVLVCLANLNSFPVQIPAGSKIAQMLIMPCQREEVVIVKEVGTTERGSGGFGSTGG